VCFLGEVSIERVSGHLQEAQSQILKSVSPQIFFEASSLQYFSQRSYVAHLNSFSFYGGVKFFSGAL